MPGLRLLQHQWENALWILAAEVEDECCLSVDHLQVSVHPKQQLGHQDQQFLLVEMGVLPVPLLRAFFFWLYGPVLSALSFWVPLGWEKASALCPASAPGFGRSAASGSRLPLGPSANLGVP